MLTVKPGNNRGYISDYASTSNNDYERKYNNNGHLVSCFMCCGIEKNLLLYDSVKTDLT